jgi:aerobic carbon-monoxide dehydrogenase large subunit
MATTQPPTSDAADRLFGASVRRKEDPRFITGRGMYTDDVRVPGTLHAAFVRSPHPHARIRAVDTSAARGMPNVAGVFTGKDLADGGVNGIPVGWLLPGLKPSNHSAIAVDRVRYVGEPVAVVVASDAYTARDAAEAIAVDYEPLPAVADSARAVAAGAPLVRDDAPGNVCFEWEIGDAAATDSAFAAARRTNGSSRTRSSRVRRSPPTPAPATSSRCT